MYKIYSELHLLETNKKDLDEQLCKSAEKFCMDQIILTKFIGMVILHINLSDFFFSFIDKVYEEQLKQTFTCNYSVLRVFMKLINFSSLSINQKHTSFKINFINKTEEKMNVCHVSYKKKFKDTICM